MIFIVTYDLKVCNPYSIDALNRANQFRKNITASDLKEAKDLFESKFNLNPFYFSFDIYNPLS